MANNCKTAFSLHVVESASDEYSFWFWNIFAIMICDNHASFFVEASRVLVEFKHQIEDCCKLSVNHSSQCMVDHKSRQPSSLRCAVMMTGVVTILDVTRCNCKSWGGCSGQKHQDPQVNLDELQHSLSNGPLSATTCASQHQKLSETLTQ